MRKTKIICTIGPASDTPEVMRSLIAAGMNVARLNFSHGNNEEKAACIERLCAVRAEMGVPLALLADTRGPEIRIGAIPGGPVRLQEGQTFTLQTEECEGDARRVSVSYAGLPEDVSVGGHILLDDGLIDLRVESKTDSQIVCAVLNGGPISSHKGVNVPGVKLRLPYIDSRDRADLRFIASQPFSYVAASFTRSADDIRALREEIRRHGASDIKIIAKIENAEGLQNIDAIMDAADGIMVARGDLGVETPLEELPVLQKMLIQNAYRRGMPVITATQMLESMIKNPRPTRAETSDVANAVYDGTSAVMLSGETAAGVYPAEACHVMAQIAQRTERAIDYKKRFLTREYTEENTITNAVARAAVTIAHGLNCQAILTLSETGRTAR
ncbi:MAG: pyruvate kinase, partial [Oscillospiraceae bacterium]|nr:pyruvate kinase [Oscillospiraceae bacterium]